VTAAAHYVNCVVALGLNIIKDPVHVHDLQATILHLMGFDHDKFTYRFMGCALRLTLPNIKVQQGLLT
jgi:arylsulfatase A-like enzyme